MATDLDYPVVCQVVLETKGDSLGSSLAVPLSGMKSKVGLEFRMNIKELGSKEGSDVANFKGDGTN
jgi:hypothetical protein